MKYEEISLLRKLVSDEVHRCRLNENEFNAYSQSQKQSIKDDFETALSLKKQVENLEFKIV